MEASAGAHARMASARDNVMATSRDVLTHALSLVDSMRCNAPGCHCHILAVQSAYDALRFYEDSAPADALLAAHRALFGDLVSSWIYREHTDAVRVLELAKDLTQGRADVA